ncbi:hypothetical protein CHLNCDRAFT_140584 [Chlorella variabilis]|uniref:DUF819 protein n=1 Tax=Chlorella variabilis TaxID=554065 RepID=E1Z5Q9_CHLVA|nr:hypothetical protein CHLNCDRAFT_140584 [Chlorella variabilis]EFN58797.1 hypothetical protein CHLNCDRAFT_140584 [Chlorella variabilis]|eukprot:XP_005850899.1 hypothetical protein CHLNCDRAFT_140584 [Chlorella variabilis]
MLLALAAAATGLLPTASSAADAIWTYLMPLSASLILLEGDLSQLLSSAGPTLVAFVIGAIGTVVGTTVAFWLVGPRLGPDGYKVAASLCASYIGGSVNFAAVSQAVGLAPGPVLAGAMTADNCVMALYIATIMSIPAEGKKPAAAQHGSASGPGGSIPTPVTGESLALSMAAAALACTLGNHLAAAAGVASSGLAVMAVLSSGLAMLGSRLAAQFSRTKPQADSAAAAAAAQSPPIHSSEQPPQQGAAPIHLGICLAGGRLLRLPMKAVLIASNANVGGPATAAAMATSKGWQDMIQPAMLTGSLGYAIANGIGLAMGQWMHSWHVFV